MKTLKNNMFKIGLGISLIALGYTIAKFINFRHFEISKEIDISNIISLIVTVWIAIIVTNVFEKDNNDNRIEKDMMITRVEDVYHITSSIQLESNTGQIHISEVSSSLKRINTSLSSVYKLVKKCQFAISDEIKEKIYKCQSELRNILTSTPSVSVENLNDAPIEIRESIIYYNKERVSQIEVKLEDLKNLLLELQIEINKK